MGNLGDCGRAFAQGSHMFGMAVENRYSMMARQYESLFPALEQMKISEVSGGSRMKKD